MMIENSYIAVDIETTGLDPKTERIIEIGAVRVIDGREEEHFHKMIDPHRTLESRIVELTGINDEMLKEAEELVDVLPEFLEFCGELPLLGHHVIFDYSFLKRAAVNMGLTFDKNGLDTLKICRCFMPGEEKKNLEAACRYYAVERGQAHRALSDAIDAHRLYQVMLIKYGSERPEVFRGTPLIYKVKKEQPASKRQKEDLRDLLKYHRIDVLVQIDDLSRNEVSRLKDKIISQYGRKK